MNTLCLLLVLQALFMLRVGGQLLVAWQSPSWLPPMEQWKSGLLPYPWLLCAQILILALQSKIGWDWLRGRGFFAQNHPQLGKWLVFLGFLYLIAMMARYPIQMALYPELRWLGKTIPIFFHWVLALYVIVLGNHMSTKEHTTSGHRGDRLKNTIS